MCQWHKSQALESDHKKSGPKNTKYESNFGYYTADNMVIYVISCSITRVKLRKVWRHWHVPSNEDRINECTPLTTTA